MWWDDAVHIVTSVHSYKWVVQALFEDGNVNWGRILVLKEFTKDVCEHHPNIAAEVWSHYKETSEALSHHLSSRH